MKMKTLFIATSYAVLTMFLLSNCSAKKEESTTTDEMHETSTDVPAAASGPQFQVDAGFQQQLSSLFASYVKLKDAFVTSDAANVTTEAAATEKVFAAVDMKLLTGAAHNDWMTYAGALESALKEIQASNDIEVQRTSFSTLSDNMYKAIKAYGLGGATAYYEYCPMAFNNQGAYWLSDQSAIRNPYFGDKMLKCGRVEETLN
jgi:Cu(I)/Ag(I) efflux system membrane fusion protein